MPRDYGQLAPNKVRRQDREVTDKSWIRAFLSKAPYGAFATVNDDRPFINSNLFVYDEADHAIYFHTARVGRTQANVDADEAGVAVCFSAFDMGRLLPAPKALEFSVEYQGVVAFGTGTIVRDYEEATRVLQLLLDKYAPHLKPGEDYEHINEEELKRTAVFKIAIESWSAKKKEVDADFPGAFVYPIGG
ncbi:MAG: pyridoxamine 5'-phosphate oxidase family protein [Bacteroidota bacterium]